MVIDNIGFSLFSDELTYDDLVFHDEEIGRGGHSTVTLATFKCGVYTTSGKSYEEAAIKNLHRLNEEEVKIMKKLCHPNIVTFLGYIKNGPGHYIVMERCKQSLWKFLQDLRNPLNDACRRCWIRQSADAIRYLHDNNVVHRDLRSENCLLTSDNTLKVADFGIAKIADKTGHTTDRQGFNPYIAPEVVDEKKFSKASDIYALGFLIWEIYTREIPKPVEERNAVGQCIAERHNIPDYLKSLMNSCWEYDYSKRPKIEEVQQQLL